MPELPTRAGGADLLVGAWGVRSPMLTFDPANGDLVAAVLPPERATWTVGAGRLWVQDDGAHPPAVASIEPRDLKTVWSTGTVEVRDVTSAVRAQLRHVDPDLGLHVP